MENLKEGMWFDLLHLQESSLQGQNNALLKPGQPDLEATYTLAPGQCTINTERKTPLLIIQMYVCV